MTLYEIQALNHLGIDHIDGGDYEEAVEVFSHAITLLSGCTLEPTPIGGMTTNSKHKNHSKDVAPVVVVVADNAVVTVVHSLEDEVRNNNADSTTTTSEFYTHPFHLECVTTASTMCTGPDLTSEQYNICAIACLFNLALCFHLEWEEQKTCHTYLLQKALSLYEQAISLTRRTTPLSSSDSILMVLMAICSNATHCNSELVNLDQVQRWNGILRKIIKFTNDKEILIAENYFSLNAFFNSFGRVAAHAA